LKKGKWWAATLVNTLGLLKSETKYNQVE